MTKRSKKRPGLAYYKSEPRKSRCTNTLQSYLDRLLGKIKSYVEALFGVHILFVLF